MVVINDKTLYLIILRNVAGDFSIETNNTITSHYISEKTHHFGTKNIRLMELWQMAALYSVHHTHCVVVCGYP
jgi:hypothetical protein